MIPTTVYNAELERKLIYLLVITRARKTQRTQILQYNHIYTRKISDNTSDVLPTVVRGVVEKRR